MVLFFDSRTSCRDTGGRELEAHLWAKAGEVARTWGPQQDHQMARGQWSGPLHVCTHTGHSHVPGDTGSRVSLSTRKLPGWFWNHPCCQPGPGKPLAARTCHCQRGLLLTEPGERLEERLELTHSHWAQGARTR